LNKAKSKRNLDRGLKRVYHQADPVAYPDDASDNSSLITVSERGIDKEIAITPGITITPGFHEYLYDLDKYLVYIPLSIFTNANLRAINRDSCSLTLKKINPKASRSKPPQVLDTDAFQKKYGKEEDLSHQLWIEAARNYVRFTADTGINEDWSKRWDQHFGFFEGRDDAAENFPAILELDIRMCKDYNASPFMYSAEYYEKEYEKAKMDHRIKKVEAGPTWRSPFTFGRSSALSDPLSKFLPSKGTGRGPHSAPSIPSFRKGNGGDPATAVCLICARRGHMYSACTHTTFEDKKPTFACQRDDNIQTVKGSQVFCRNWNIRGDSEKACTHGDTRVHWCTFCGDKKHHAFSWSCRHPPAKSS
jgi:hypothetical protein